MALQRNNGSPRGYGQPKRDMRQALMRPEDEEVFGQSPEVGDMRLMGQEEAPSVYPAQPQYRSQPKSPFALEDQGVSTGITGQVKGKFQGGGGNVMSRQLNPAKAQQMGDAAGRRLGKAPASVGSAFSGSFGAGDGGGELVQGTPAYLKSQAYHKSLFSTPMDPNDPRMAQGQQNGYIDPVTGQFNSYGPGYQEEQPAPSLFAKASQAVGQAQGNPMGDPNRGALEQYGTGNIPGAGNVQTGNFMSQLEGFNTNGWGTGEAGTESIKNTVGRYLSQVDVTQPGALQNVLSIPGFMDTFPMARVVEHPNGDLLDLGDGNGPVDVIRGATAGGQGAAWQWGVGGGQAPSGPGGPSAQAYMGGIPPTTNTQVGQLDGTQVPEVGNENSAMEFLQWLMQQQQQGQMPNGINGNTPGVF